MSKGPGVQRMFDAIAGRYDLMNRTMTLGQDQRWRRFVVARAGDPGRGWVLDLATGTGLVVHHGGLGVAAQLAGHAAAHGVRGAAGGKAGDDAQVLDLCLGQCLLANAGE